MRNRRRRDMKIFGLKKIIGVGLISVFFAMGYSAAQEKILLDLKRLANKPRPEIEKFLGTPSKLIDDVFRSTRGYTYPAVRGAYMNDSIEVTYLEGGARYFKIWVQ